MTTDTAPADVLLRLADVDPRSTAGADLVRHAVEAARAAGSANDRHGVDDWLRNPAVFRVVAEDAADAGTASRVLEQLVALSLVRSMKSLAQRYRTLVLQRAAEIEAEARVAEREARKIEPRVTVANAVGGGPPPADVVSPETWSSLTVPLGYRIDGNVVYRDNYGKNGKAEPIRVCRLAFVVGLTRDARGGEHKVNLIWRPMGSRRGWDRRILPRTFIAKRRSIVDLADHGMNVGDTNADEVIRWLAAFESENARWLQPSIVVSQMGWALEVKRSVTELDGDDPDEEEDAADSDSLPLKPPWIPFFWGSTPIVPPGYPHPVPVFQAATGTEGYCSKFRYGGSWEGWLATVEKARPFPLMTTGVLMTAASVLLTILGARGFTINLGGDPGTGKTTTLTLSASCQAYPPRTEGGIIESWNIKAFGISQLLSCSRSMTVFFDDAMDLDAKQRGVIGDAIFAIAGGQAGTRGGLGPGGAPQLTSKSYWQLDVLSSHEGPIVPYSNARGARARCVEIPHPPSGENDPNTAILLREIEEGAVTHYGHLIPRLVALLQSKTPAQIAEMRRWYKERAKLHISQAVVATGGSTGGRVAAYAAALEVAEMLVHDELGVPRPYGPLDPRCRTRGIHPVRVILHMASSLELRADLPGEALLVAYTEAGRVPWTFYGRHRNVIREYAGARSVVPERPTGGWSGAWSPSENYRGIQFAKSWLERLFRDRGYDWDQVIPSWVDRGWIAVPKLRDGVAEDPGEEWEKRVRRIKMPWRVTRVDLADIPCIWVTRKGIDEVLGAATAPSTSLAAASLLAAAKKEAAERSSADSADSAGGDDDDDLLALLDMADT